MVGIFIDSSNGFDKLNHDILIEKLSRYRYGIRSIANDWFHNYLNSRDEFVNYNNVLSSRIKIA